MLITFYAFANIVRLEALCSPAIRESVSLCVRLVRASRTLTQYLEQ